MLTSGVVRMKVVLDDVRDERRIDSMLTKSVLPQRLNDRRETRAGDLLREIVNLDRDADEVLHVLRGHQVSAAVEERGELEHHEVRWRNDADGPAVRQNPMGGMLGGLPHPARAAADVEAVRRHHVDHEIGAGDLVPELGVSEGR